MSPKTTLFARQRAHQRATPTAQLAQAAAVRERRLAPAAGSFNLAAAEALAAAREE
jgi:hypothetical protein